MSIRKHVARGAVVAAIALLAEPVLAQQPISRSIPDSTISFTGEVRVRGEYDRPGSGVGGDGVTFLRSRFGAKARLGGGVRMMVQFQDSRVFGERGNTASGTASQLDLHQGYLEFGGRWQSRDVALRAGRQEISIGNERLVGAAGWTATGRSFDGVRVDLTPIGGAWHATAFGATIGEYGRRGPAGAAATTRPDESLFGLAVDRAGLEGLLVHDRGARFREYAEVKRTTAYARYRTPALLDFTLDLEGAYQFGIQDRITSGSSSVLQQDVNAWMAGARLARNATTSLPAAITLGVDWLSGDSNASDGEYRAFNTLQATNHKWYGTMDVFLDPSTRTRDGGLVDALGGIAVKLSPRATVRLDAHHFWTASDVASSAAGTSRALGWEGDLTVPVQLSSVAGVEFGYSVFRPGAGAPTLGLGREGALRQWGYAQLRAGF